MLFLKFINTLLHFSLLFLFTNTVLGETSAETRSDDGFGAIRLFYASDTMEGAYIYTILNKNGQIGLQYLEGIFFNYRGKDIIEGAQTLINFQYFFGNSFNASVGVGQRTVNSDSYRNEAAGYNTVDNCSLTMKANILSLSLSNQWTWGNVTFAGFWLVKPVTLTKPEIVEESCSPESKEVGYNKKIEDNIRSRGFDGTIPFIIGVGLQF